MHISWRSAAYSIARWFRAPSLFAAGHLVRREFGALSSHHATVIVGEREAQRHNSSAAADRVPCAGPRLPPLASARRFASRWGNGKARGRLSAAVGLAEVLITYE